MKKQCLLMVCITIFSQAVGIQQNITRRLTTYKHYLQGQSSQAEKQIIATDSIYAAVTAVIAATILGTTRNLRFLHGINLSSAKKGDFILNNKGQIAEENKCFKGYFWNNPWVLVSKDSIKSVLCPNISPEKTLQIDFYRKVYVPKSLGFFSINFEEHLSRFAEITIRASDHTIIAINYNHLTNHLDKDALAYMSAIQNKTVADALTL